MAQVVAYLRSAFDVLNTTLDDTDEDGFEDEDSQIGTLLCELAQTCAPVPDQETGLTGRALRQQRQALVGGAASWPPAKAEAVRAAGNGSGAHRTGSLLTATAQGGQAGQRGRSSPSP